MKKITLITTWFVFLLLVLTMIISNTITVFCMRHGLIDSRPGDSLFPFMPQTGFVNIIVGTILTFSRSHFPLRPLHTLMQAIQEVSNGNFDVKIQLEHPKEFRRLSEYFNRMTKELSGIEILRSDFINNFSHEFKTPIVSILGFAKLLKAENLSPDQRQEYLDIIIAESRRLSTLSTTVLNLSKVESLTLLTDKRTYSLSEQIRESILLLENKWDKKQIDWTIDMDELEITADDPLLKQVWMNLLDNAVKFSHPGGRIQVTLRKSIRSVVFVLTDNGPGMDTVTLASIFDKFYQGDTSHHVEGNGLGLPLVRKIVELHGGSVSVKSSPGEGSTFIVHLPE